MYKVLIRVEMTAAPVMLHAKEVDFKAMPLVYIRDISKGLNSSVLIVKEDAYEYFADTKTLILPFTSIVMVQELKAGISTDTDTENNVIPLKGEK